MSILLYILICIFEYLRRWYQVSKLPPTLIQGDVLLIFAHPDDEAMFFSPLLNYLRSKNIICHFLCLSSGDSEGKGEQREQELYESGKYFGVNKRNIKIVNHPELRDGLREKWSHILVKHEVDSYLKKNGSISTLVTFDKFGISSHPNHIAVHNGVLELKRSMPSGLLFLQIRSRSIVLKYMGIFSVIGSLFFAKENRDRRNFNILIPPFSLLYIWNAMMNHATQLVWFRYLFVIFSSYTYLNEFTELKP
ncbi:unnamed protein product [Phytomonas sp. Hart1]|nr:unnamed protein product [Phytomonas sp. Hart1]|eukprot:CCW69559.1 unnamed protein product [Phytomonas sp. isolate Hart1]